MNKEEIIEEYIKNVGLVYGSRLQETIGYSIADTITFVANCAAVLTILNFTKEN